VAGIADPGYLEEEATKTVLAQAELAAPVGQK